MKRNGPNHPKMHHLASLLRLEGRWGAVGLAESIWHVAMAYAPQGDVGRFPNEIIAGYMDWKGDPDQIIKALFAAGLLDPCACHRWRIHDWPQNADQTAERAAKKLGGFLKCYTDTERASAELVCARQQASAELAACQHETSLPYLTKPNQAIPSRAQPSAATVRARDPEPSDIEANEPTPATPTEARAIAVERLGPWDDPNPANPLVQGRRPELELEWLRLLRKIAERTGKNPEDVVPRGDGYKPGLNPADLRDNRLLRDVMDLRATWAALEAEARINTPRPAPPTLPAAEADAALEERRRRAADGHRRLRELLNGQGGIGPDGGEGEAKCDPSGGGGGAGAGDAGPGQGARIDAGSVLTPAPPGPGPAGLRGPDGTTATPGGGAAGGGDGHVDPALPHEFEPDPACRAKVDRAPLCLHCGQRREDIRHELAVDAWAGSRAVAGGA